MVSVSCSSPFQRALPASRSRLLPLAVLAAGLMTLALNSGIASAQQGKCFKNSDGREICCDANGNCK